MIKNYLDLDANKNNFMRIWGVSIFVIAVILLSLVSRYKLLGVVSRDMELFLIPWFSQIQNLGGLKSLAKQVGNYGIAYQTFIGLSTYITGNPLLAYKIFSIFFDYVLASIAGYLLFSMTKSKTEVLLLFSAILVSPVIMMNSSCWGQCDSIWSAFCLASIASILARRTCLAGVFYGVAIAFKLQAIFIFPFLIYVCFVRSLSPLKLLSVAFVAFVFLNLGGILSGRSLVDIMLIYVRQTGTYTQLSLNYPSFWCFFAPGQGNIVINPLNFRPMAMSLTVFLLFSFFYYAFKVRPNPSNGDLMLVLLISLQIILVFLPSMHERYGYLNEVVAIFVVFINIKLLFPCVLLHAITLSTYGAYLIGSSISLSILSALNIICLCVYIMFYFSILIQNRT